MFDGDSNIKLGGDLLNIDYPKLTLMRGFEHTDPLLFNDV